MTGAAVRARSTARAVAELVGSSRLQAAVAVLLAFGQAALLLPVALLVRHIFDVDVPHDDEAAIVFDGLLVFGCYAASTALSVASRVYAARVTKVALGRTRRRLVAQLETLPLSWHDRHDAGALHAIVIQDCERVDRMLNNLMSQVLPAAATLLALGAVAAVIDPLLCAVMLVFVPLMLIGTRRFARRFTSTLAAWHATAEAFSTHTQLLLMGLATIRAAGADERDRERFERETDTFVEAGYAAAVTGSRHQALQGALAAAAGVAVLVVGGLLVARSRLTIGGLLAFYAVVALMLRQLSTALAAAPLVLEGAIAIRRVRELAGAGEPGAYAGTRRLLRFTGAVELDEVSFAYDRLPALTGVSLRIDAGEQLCIVGENGAGKTTLIAVMLGLYRPQSGHALADGVALEELDLGHLRRQTGVILQDAVLFAASVRENLLLGCADADDAAIAAALRAATADEVVDALPLGLDTVLGDGGSGLSGGERQRIAIARAVLARPALILLDEPTAHLPSELSARVIENLAALPWRPTVVIVTHDRSIAARVGRVVRLEGGCVVGG